MNSSFRYIVITRPDFWDGEVEAIVRLFEGGLEQLFIRKPGSTAAQREALVAAIPACYHDRLIVSEHLTTERTRACHSIEELREAKQNPNYEWLCLSPIFDSISKKGYKAAFTEQELLAARDAGIIDERVLALGGVCEQNIAKAREYGFGGVLVLGDAWRL